MGILRTILIATFPFLTNCHSNNKLGNEQIPKAIRLLYSATSKKSHLNQLHEDYRLFFGQVAGNGIDKQHLSEMLDWDYALHAHKKILDTLYFSQDSIVLNSHEENDFSRLIGFPGWNSQNTFILKENKVLLQVYVPLKEVDYKSFLKPAIDWLEKNDSSNLIKVYDSEEKALIQNSNTAVLWVQFLTKWKKAALH